MKTDGKIDSVWLEERILRLAAGERSCMEEMYACLRQPVYIFCLWLVKSREAAEDITQQTFVEVFRSVCRYQARGRPQSWIYAIARNLCMDYLKESRRELAASDLVMSPKGEGGAGVDFADNTFVNEALSSLGEQERQIILLYVFAGLKQTEISRVLKIPYIQVRSKYGYAIRKLKMLYDSGKTGG